MDCCETEGYVSKPKVTEAKGLAEFTSNGSGRRQIGRRTSYKAHGDTGGPVSLSGRKERGTPDAQPVLTCTDNGERQQAAHPAPFRGERGPVAGIARLHLPVPKQAAPIKPIFQAKLRSFAVSLQL